MTNSQIIKLITKYALLLALFFAAENGLSMLAKQYVRTAENMNDKLFLTMSPVIVVFALNIIMAAIVYSDIKKTKIKTNYVILATLVSKPIGVFAFLIFALLNKESTKVITN